MTTNKAPKSFATVSDEELARLWREGLPAAWKVPETMNGPLPLTANVPALRAALQRLASAPDGLRAAAQQVVDECGSDSPPSLGAIDRLRAALGSAPPPEILGATERFEREAEAFQQATGYMAPGKDVPIGMGATSDYEMRRELAWEAWRAGAEYRVGSAPRGEEL